MTSDRIKEIQQATAYPDSVSVKQALLQVWNECSQPTAEADKAAALVEALEILLDRIEYAARNGFAYAIETRDIELIKTELNNYKNKYHEMGKK